MTESTNITKTKDPSRIAAGKKLVEWNKRNKQKILEKTDALRDAETPLTPQDDSSKESTRDFSIAGVGIISILAIGVLVYYFHTPTEKKIAKKENEDDIFKMK